MSKPLNRTSAWVWMLVPALTCVIFHSFLVNWMLHARLNLFLQGYVFGHLESPNERKEPLPAVFISKQVSSYSHATGERPGKGGTPRGAHARTQARGAVPVSANTLDVFKSASPPQPSPPFPKWGGGSLNCARLTQGGPRDARLPWAIISRPAGAFGQGFGA